MNKFSQKGFTHYAIVASAAFLLVIGFTTWKVLGTIRNNIAVTPDSPSTNQISKTISSLSDMDPASKQAENNSKTGSSKPSNSTKTPYKTSKDYTSPNTTADPNVILTPPSTPIITLPATYTVSFSGTDFSPSSITINSGDTITFVNNSTSTDAWPVSDPDPSNNYPGFDPLSAIAPGNSWSFTFNNVGTWAYHDHQQTGITGTITVQ